jgi:stage V sporulation protein D (sporulation-specific penicillin-binding protein)
MSRHKIILTSFLLCFFIVTCRLFYWQIIKNSEYGQKANNQTYKMEINKAIRGQIYSSDEFPLVINQTDYTISIYKPNLEQDLDSVYQQIDQIHPDFISKNLDILKNFKDNNQQKWIDLNTLFTQSESDQLSLIPGITVNQLKSRYYPENNLAKDILGFVAKDSQSNYIGYGGLENYYNKQLQGKTGFTWGPQDGTGKTILTKKSWNSPAYDGNNLYTSINRAVQYLAQQSITEGIEKYQADSASVSIMEAQTGRVIAMASVASTSSATPSASKNPTISDLFEPGSIFKPLVVTMALDQKSINTDFICQQCSHPRTIGGYTISNWDNSIHPNSPLKDIIKNSDNIGMSYIISQLGLDNFLSYYQKLRLNQKTGIDLQGESRPTLKSSWPEIDLATASFGQGIVVTQINMLRAFNTIANDGVMVNPTTVDYYTDYLGKKYIPKNNNKETRIFSDTSTSQMKEILKYAVENGVVDQFRPNDLEVCAKSGTAQVAVKGSYTDSSTIASYIGFTPCNNPKFTMIVTINNPRSSPWGSSTAAPIWYELASKIRFLL